jgi:phospholipase/carboxylesterase
MGLAPYLDPRLHILAARAPITLGSWMYAWYNIQFLPNGDFLISEPEMRRSIELVDTFLDEIVVAYNLDPTRLFLGGFSQGAIQSVGMMLLQPEKIAGVLAMSGRWPAPIEAERAADERLAGKPVLAVHGLYDDVIPVRYGREVRDKLSALPVALTYKEYPMAHQVSMESLEQARDWLKAQLD